MVNLAGRKGRMISYEEIDHPEFKYRLFRDYSHYTSLIGYDVDTEFLRLTTYGLLTFKAGYMWDGATGPAIDTVDNMRASLVHDGFCQLINEKRLPFKVRKYADYLLRTIFIEDGKYYGRRFVTLRAWYFYLSVSAYREYIARFKS